MAGKDVRHMYYYSTIEEDARIKRALEESRVQPDGSKIRLGDANRAALMYWTERWENKTL